MKAKGKILIMDDDNSFCEAMNQILTTIQYKGVFVKNGEGMLKEYQKELQKDDPYDVVIIDLLIKEGMGGEEAIKKLLELDPKAKIILSSGISHSPLVTSYEKYGIKDLLMKPYNLNTLEQKLSKWVK